MFIAIWKDEQKNLCGGIFFNHELFYRETFNPETEIVTIIDFKIHGGSYAERKNDAQNLAIQWSWHMGDFEFSWGEIAYISHYFEKIGKRYGLLTEFRENGIC